MSLACGKPEAGPPSAGLVKLGNYNGSAVASHAGLPIDVRQRRMLDMCERTDSREMAICWLENGGLTLSFQHEGMLACKLTLVLSCLNQGAASRLLVQHAVQCDDNLLLVSRADTQMLLQTDKSRQKKVKERGRKSLEKSAQVLPLIGIELAKDLATK